MNWPQEIAKLVFVKQALKEADTKCLWPYYLPSVAATMPRLIEVESYLGYPLDKLYAAFLLHADGWNGFYQTVDLFSTADLIGSEKMKLAMESLQATSDAAFVQAGISREDMLPIAATTSDRDLFLLAKPDSSIAGTIIWLAGEEVERFKNFDEFFLAMVDYNREELNYFTGV